MRIALFLLATSVLATGQPTAKAAPATPAGPSALLRLVRGTVTFSASPDAKAEPLGEKDIGRALYAGQILRVGEGGTLEVQLASGPLVISEPGDLAIPPRPSEKKSAVLQVLDHFLRAPGGALEKASLIYEPAPGSAVQAARFMIRWDRRQWSGPLSLRVSDGAGTELWSKAGVPAEGGIFLSQEARQRLSEFRHATEARPLILTITTDDGQAVPVHFRLLSQADEKQLVLALAQWDRATDGWPQHAGRAAILLEAGLLNQAEAEGEQALATAPTSIALRKALAEIEQRLGRADRADELTAEPEK